MRAVNVPELRHRYNEVVFSSQGQRPDQHKLSFGDLDGDIYFVTWDEKLVNPFQANFQPAIPTNKAPSMTSE